MNSSALSWRQQLFDESVAHIRKQGKPSFFTKEGGAFDICAYKSPEGLGCAAAPFITDYRPEMERSGWAQLARAFPHCLDMRAVQDSWFVVELQYAHDAAVSTASLPNKLGDHEFLGEYEENMQKLAKRFGLVYTPPGVAP